MQLGVERRARDEGFREGLVGEAELQDQRQPPAALTKEPRALLASTVLIVYPLSQNRPAIRDMLATGGQLILVERPANELAHIVAQVLVKRVLPPVRLNQQRETAKLTEQFHRPIIGGAWDARDAPQPCRHTRRLRVGHARGLRLPEAGGLPLQRADAVADQIGEPEVERVEAVLDELLALRRDVSPPPPPLSPATLCFPSPGPLPSARTAWPAR